MAVQKVYLLNQKDPVIVTGGLVPKGAYAAGTDYAVGDSVDYNGSSYVMFVDAAAGTLPTDTTKWQILAEKGDTGGTDEKVKYDAADTTAGYVADKIIAGTGITVAEGTGGDENKLVITNSDKGSDVDLSGLVPYTGASSDVDLGGQILTADNLISTTSGFQAYNSGGFNFFSDAGVTQVGSISSLVEGQYIHSHSLGEATHDFSNLTANQTYTFPDATGTIALTSDLGSGGITRSVSSISTNTTAGSNPATDYVYFVTGTTTLTLPTAVGNTNRYTIKSISGTTVIDGDGTETIDGSATITIANEDSVDLVSDNTEWKVV